jgi:hypothetical protein
MGILDWELLIGEALAYCSLKRNGNEQSTINNQQSTINNQQSTIHNPQSAGCWGRK